MEDNFEIINSLNDFKNISKEWTEFLANSSIDSRFLQNPSVIDAQVRASNKNQSPFCIILRDSKKQIICIAPCLITRKKFGLQLSVISLPSPKARILTLFSNSIVYSSNANIDECTQKIFNILVAKKEIFDYIFFDNLSTENPIWRLVNEHLHEIPELRFNIASPKMEKVYYLALPNSFEEWQKSFSKKRRYNMNRTTRLFREAFDDNIKIVRIEKESQVDDFLDQLDMLYNKSWQAKTMGQWQRNNAVQNEYFKSIAKKGWLRSYILYAAKKPVAFLVGYQYNNTYEYMEPGYDPELSNLSPGNVLNSLLIEDLYRHETPKNVDFGFGENQYKRVLGNRSYDACTAYLTFSGSWRYLVSLQLIMNKIYNCVRSTLIKRGWDNTIRRIIKRKKM